MALLCDLLREIPSLSVYTILITTGIRLSPELLGEGRTHVKGREYSLSVGKRRSLSDSDEFLL